MPPDPLILAFDTSAARCAAALLSDGAVIAARDEAVGRGQAERLMPMLEEVLAEGGATWRDLSALAVGTGPGNFTGIRISVAAARGLALALGIPSVGVTLFEALAAGQARPVLCAVPTVRGALAVQRMLPGARVWGAVATCDGDDPAQALPAPFARSGIDVIGAGAGALAAITGGRVLVPQHPLAEAVARVAAARVVDAGGRADLPRAAPLYLRPADAAPPADPPPVIVD